MKLVPCSCDYSCKYSDDGVKFVHPKTRKRHADHDARGEKKQRTSTTDEPLEPCFCTRCFGKNILMSRRTINRHVQDDRERQARASSHIPHPDSNIEDRAEPSLSLQEPQININYQEDDQAWDDQHMEPVDDTRLRQDEHLEVSLEKTLKLKLLELQSLMDSGNNSLTNQTQIFKLLFHNIQDVNLGDIPSNPNYQDYSIGTLIRMLKRP